IVTGSTGDAAARVGARSAVVESLQRAPIVGIADGGAGPEQLIERHCAVENVSAGEPEHLLQVEWAQSLAADDACFEPRCIAIDGFDHQIRHRLPLIVLWAPPAGNWGATGWQNGLARCPPAGASVSSKVDGITISMMGSRLHPSVRASQ